MPIMMSDDRQDPPIPNSYWVVRDRLAAGEYPGAIDPDEAATKLGALLDAGVDHFIDLTKEGEFTSFYKPLAPYSEIAGKEASGRGLTVRWERHPICNMSIPSSPEQTAATLDAIDSALDDSKTVYVHCWGGVGRTGTVVGCWLVRHGCTGDEALGRVAALFTGMEKSHRFYGSPETTRQPDAVRRCVVRQRRQRPG